MSVKIFQKEKKNKFCTSQRDKSRVSIQNLINYFLLDFFKNFPKLNAEEAKVLGNTIAVIFPMSGFPTYQSFLNTNSCVVCKHQTTVWK